MQKLFCEKIQSAVETFWARSMAPPSWMPCLTMALKACRTQKKAAPLGNGLLYKYRLFRGFR